jgi:hypothetical protein
MSGLLVPSKQRERRTAFGANNLPVLSENSYTLRNKYEGPSFISMTHFTTKTNLITFLNVWGKIEPLIFEGHFAKHVTLDVMLI